jgi:hypothetical protein
MAIVPAVFHRAVPIASLRGKIARLSSESQAAFSALA